MEKLYDLFNNKASLYAANRPSYSPNVLKYLQKDLGFSSTALGADIGCGTGQLTKILAEYFNLVYAVEPNNSMMKECQKYLYDYKNILYKCHSAENIEIDDNKLDMNNHSSDLFLKNEEVLLKYCPLYKRNFHATEFKCDSFQECFTKDSYQYRYFPNDNTEYLDYDTFISRTLSASYAIQKGNPSFQNFVKELATVFTNFSVDQRVKMELSTVIYSGHLR